MAAIALTAVVLFYVYHGFIGQLGFLSYRELLKEIEAAERAFAEVSSEREELERQVRRLRGPDASSMAIEEALRAYGYVREDELVFLLDPAETGSRE
ncbi:MAG: septum formation initiator family protein [Geminicoccaceae bacterium]